MKSIRIKNFRGDTIIEVMIAAALIMATLGVGYALSRQALRQTTDDSLRNQAIAYGQSQIEFIKNAIANRCAVGDSTCSSPNTLLTSYQGLPSGFCILNTGVAAASGNASCTSYTGGATGTSAFSIKNTYDGTTDVNNKLFKVLVTWTPLSVTRGTGAVQQLSFYYKSP